MQVLDINEIKLGRIRWETAAGFVVTWTRQ